MIEQVIIEKAQEDYQELKTFVDTFKHPFTQLYKTLHGFNFGGDYEKGFHFEVMYNDTFNVEIYSKPYFHLGGVVTMWSNERILEFPTVIDTFKVCSHCGKFFDVNEKGSEDNLDWFCKDCTDIINNKPKYEFLTPRELIERLLKKPLNYTIDFTTDREETVLTREFSGWYGIKLTRIFDESDNVLAIGYYGGGATVTHDIYRELGERADWDELVSTLTSWLETYLFDVDDFEQKLCVEIRKN